MSIPYLPRTLHTIDLRWGLFTDKAKFHKELKRLGVPIDDYPQFPGNGGARVNFLVNEKEGELALVCIGECPGSTGIDIAALLAHEAVHVWHRHCELIGERDSAKATEYEPYAIQHLVQELLYEYARQKGLLK